MKFVRVLLVVATTLATAVSAITGFGGSWNVERLGGWPLIGHLVTAPLVMAGFTLLALVAGGGHRFQADDCFAGRVTKALFWLVMLSVWGLMLTMLAAMTTIFGYIGQDRLMAAHKLSGLTLLISAAAYAIFWMMARIGGKQSKGVRA